MPTESHILHLADRIAVLIDARHEPIGQSKAISEKIRDLADAMFVPELMDAFLELSAEEWFWLDAARPSWQVSRMPRTHELGLDDLLGLGKVFSYVIDFRSRFTATHSAGVAATSEALAGLMGFSERECVTMRVAGYLHDLGKLAVPAEILEKPGRLTVDEFSVMRAHTYHTYSVLERIPSLDVINAWGAFHHERLDGRGYPFHLTDRELTLGSRIMAVADVFTAVTEDRPYREAMPKERGLEIVQKMAASSALDAKVVSVLAAALDDVAARRKTAQRDAAREYETFER